MAAYDYDVVIVGGGLVGAALACQLGQSLPALRVLVCDQQDEVPQYGGDQFDPRVVALSESSVQLLRGIDVWQAIRNQRVCAYQGMEVWDGEGSGRIHFSAAEVHRPELGFIVENSVVLAALRERMEAYRGLRWLSPVECETWQACADGSSELALSNGEVLTTALLVAADGAESKIRQQAQLPVREWDYHQVATVATIQCEFAHDNIARQRFSFSGPLALLPLPDPKGAATSHYCSIVWSQQTEVSETLKHLDDSAFCQALTRASEYCLGEVLQVDRRHHIPLRQMHVQEYGRPGFVLLGDAAHRIHPLAGQGANLGFYDVVCLAGEIVRAVNRHVPLQHHSVLQRYQRQRKWHNLSAVGAMEAFKRLFASQSPSAVVLRNFGMARLNSMDLVKHWFIDAAAGRISG